MLSNTSYSELKADLVPGEYQPKFQPNTLTSINANNNNNDVSIYKNTNPTSNSLQPQSTKPFTFYTSSNSSSCVSNTKSTIVTQANSSEVSPRSTAGECSKFIQFEPFSYNNSKQEINLNKKIFDNIRNDSALNDVFCSDDGVVCLKSKTDKATGDTRSSFNSRNSSNCSSKSSKSDKQKKPMCRTEDQENAFRQIEDVHNYSKLNRYGYCNDESSRAVNVAIYSSNSSNQDEYDEEDDEEEDEEEEEEEEEAVEEEEEEDEAVEEEEQQEQEEEEDDEEFDVVDFEQQLHTNVKKSIAIGQQSVNAMKALGATFKSESHSKIPDVKHHVFEENITLKTEEEDNASPSDHLARRPMNAFLIFCKRHRGIVKDKYKNFENRSITKVLGEWWASLDANDKKCYVNLAKQNKDAFFSANPNFKWYKLPAPSLRTLNTRPNNVDRVITGPGDYQCYARQTLTLTQNTLSYNTITSCDTYNRTEPKKVSYFKLADETQMGELNSLIGPNSTPLKNDALQEALSETSEFFKTGCKRKSSTPLGTSKTKLLQSDNSFSSSEEDMAQRKSVRLCKGKKYQELINSGQIAAVTSKKQVSSKPSKTTTMDKYQSSVNQIEKCSKVNSSTKNDLPLPKIDAKPKLEENRYAMQSNYSDAFGLTKQQFSFFSFDLEDKIRNLPAQCLETYLQRKKNTKRKKKINSKKRSSPIQPKIATVAPKQASQSLNRPKTALEVKEQMVGSQKRKARKESITRRDINSIQNDVQLLMGNSPVTSVLVTGRTSPTPHTLISVNLNATSDLLILAEVAANRTEIAQ